MSTIKGTGTVINVLCNDTPLPEFPNLHFGTLNDGTRLFDATYLIKQQNPDNTLSVEDFFKKFDFQIQAIAKTYNLSVENLVRVNNQGHQLIYGCLCYPFLSYIEPQFCTYMNEVVDEMFTTGMVISDSYLTTLVKRRLSPELYKAIWDGGDRRKQ